MSWTRLRLLSAMYVRFNLTGLMIHITGRPSPCLARRFSSPPSEVTAAMERFEELKAAMINAKPLGKIEVRAHGMPLLDSFLDYKETMERFAIWTSALGLIRGRNVSSYLT